MDAQDKDMRTPLVEAIINNHIEVARYLIQSGACVYHVVSGCNYIRQQCKIRRNLGGVEFNLPVLGL